MGSAWGTGVGNSVACASCGFLNREANSHCEKCGAVLRLARVDLAAERQRRPVTVLFADIVASTALLEKLGDEGGFLLMQRLYADWIPIIHRHKGTVKDFAGDGMMALFGAPAALEDAPLRACKAAIAIRDHMVPLAAEIEAAHGVRPEVRLGIQSGSVVLGRIEAADRFEIAAGVTTNVASRLQQLAEPGTIVISAEIQGLLISGGETAYLGERTLKGLTNPQKIYRLEFDQCRSTKV